MEIEEIFAELENIETQITKNKYVNRCINILNQEDKEIIEQFIKPDVSFDRGMQMFHMARSTLYKMQKQAVDRALKWVYNKITTKKQGDNDV